MTSLGEPVKSVLDGATIEDLFYDKQGLIRVRLPDDVETGSARFLSLNDYCRLVGSKHKPLLSYNHHPVAMLFFGLDAQVVEPVKGAKDTAVKDLDGDDGEGYDPTDDGSNCYCKQRLPITIPFIGCENDKCPISWFHIKCVNMDKSVSPFISIIAGSL
jgi:hypothetical protein